jgi:uncharacterized protein
MRAFVLGAALAFAVLGPVRAADAPMAAPPSTAQSSDSKPSDAQMRAAMDLVEATHVADGVARMIDALWSIEVGGLKATRPDLDDKQLDAVKKIITDNFLAHRDEYKRLSATVYARHFSESELRALTAFYQSDVGKRYIAETPGLIADTAQVGMAWGQTVMAEVRDKISEQLQKSPKEHT